METLISLQLRCDQLLPTFHPIGIAAMTDYSALLLKIEQHQAALKFSSRASQKVALYLSKQEKSYFQLYDIAMKINNHHQRYKNKLARRLDQINMLRSFISNMKHLYTRRMLCVGGNNPMSPLFLGLIGDAMSVLASILKLESELYNDLGSNDNHFLEESRVLWNLAGSHYRNALQKWTKIYSPIHPNVISTACSMSRCLFEVGRTSEAIKLLASLLSATRKDLCSEEKINDHHHQVKPSSLQLEMRYQHSSAIAQWCIAVYTLKEICNEEGRMKALEYLHNAVESLKQTVQNLGRTGDKSLDKVTDHLISTMKDEFTTLSQSGVVNPVLPFCQSRTSVTDQFKSFVSV